MMFCKGDYNPFSFTDKCAQAGFVQEKGGSMKQVDFYCNRCKCSMKVSYTLSGDPDALVLKGIMMKCHRCRKVVTLMNFTEGQVVAHADSHGRLYR